MRDHHATSDEDYEERAPLEKVTRLIKSGVETAKLKSYLLRNKDGVQVLTKLKLDSGIMAALKSSKMDALSTYVNMFNKKHPNDKISVIGTLTTRYGDATVAGALVSAMDNPQTKDRATRLRTDQIEAWLSSQKSVDDVFKLLRLRDNRYEALISRKLGVLENYIRVFNSRNDGQDTLLNALARGFGGEANLASMLNAAKFDPMEMKAVRLENSLIKQWVYEKLHLETVKSG